MLKVGKNFGKNDMCPLCYLHEDDQKGLLNCVILKLNCKELYDRKEESYEDIFSSKIEELLKISKLMQKCLRTREEFLQQQQQQQQQN